MLISCNENTVVINLGTGFSLTLHVPEPVGMLDQIINLEISHKNDTYLRVGKVINVVALQQMLQRLPSSAKPSPQADWAHITAEEILGLLTSKDDSPPPANHTNLNISIEHPDSGEVAHLHWSERTNSLQLVSEGGAIIQEYDHTNVVALSYEKESWCLEVHQEAFLSGFIAAKWGMDAANTFV